MANGQPGLVLDSKAPSIPLEEYLYAETRYRMLTQSNPDQARRLLALAQQDVRARWQRYEQLSRPGVVLSDQQPTLAHQQPTGAPRASTPPPPRPRTNGQADGPGAPAVDPNAVEPKPKES
jgi:hypothetical protein